MTVRHDPTSSAQKSYIRIGTHRWAYQALSGIVALRWANARGIKNPNKNIRASRDLNPALKFPRIVRHGVAETKRAE